MYCLSREIHWSKVENLLKQCILECVKTSINNFSNMFHLNTGRKWYRNSSSVKKFNSISRPSPFKCELHFICKLACAAPSQSLITSLSSVIKYGWTVMFLQYVGQIYGAGRPFRGAVWWVNRFPYLSPPGESPVYPLPPSPLILLGSKKWINVSLFISYQFSSQVDWKYMYGCIVQMYICTR